MNTKNFNDRLGSLETRVSEMAILQKEIVEMNKLHVETTKKITNALGQNFGLWEKFIGVFENFIASFKKIIKAVVFLVIVLVYNAEISNIFAKLIKYLISFWRNLSENWQTALFQAIFGILVFIIGIFIDRKFIKK